MTPAFGSAMENIVYELMYYSHLFQEVKSARGDYKKSNFIRYHQKPVANVSD